MPGNSKHPAAAVVVAVLVPHATATSACEIGTILSSDRHVRLTASTPNASCQSTSQLASTDATGPWMEAFEFATSCPSAGWSITANSAHQSLVEPSELTCSISLVKSQFGLGLTIQLSWCIVVLELAEPRTLHLTGAASIDFPTDGPASYAAFAIGGYGLPTNVFVRSVSGVDGIDWDTEIELGPGEWEFRMTAATVMLNFGGHSATSASINASVTLSDAPSADLDGDGTVAGADLGLMLAQWGTGSADLNCDGATDGADLGLLLANWTG